MSGTTIAQLRARRKELRLPLKTVAGALGFSLWWLCRMEHGKGRLSPLVLDAWARYLGLELTLAPSANHQPHYRRAA